MAPAHNNTILSYTISQRKLSSEGSRYKLALNHLHLTQEARQRSGHLTTPLLRHKLEVRIPLTSSKVTPSLSCPLALPVLRCS
jgi:hypothetical protein